MALTVGTNCYLSVASATAYFTDRLFCSAWHDASPADQSAALVTASKLVDSLPLQGRVSLSTQLMAWPRLLWSTNPDDLGIVSANYEEEFTTPGWVDVGTPQAILDAVCEEALALLSMTTADLERERLLALGLTAQTTGDASESYGSRTGRATTRPALHSEVARRFLAQYTGGTVKVT